MEKEFVSTTRTMFRRVIVIQVIMERVVMFHVQVSIQILENHVTVEVSVRMTMQPTLHRVVVMLGMFNFFLCVFSLLFPSNIITLKHTTDTLGTRVSSAVPTAVQGTAIVKFSRHMTVIWRPHTRDVRAMQGIQVLIVQTCVQDFVTPKEIVNRT